MNDLFLFVRPPRLLWPFTGPSTSFWPPLAFASLAAALRDGIGDLRVAILDAPILQMGWRTLEKEIRNLKPAYVGIGEEAVSCVEGLRLARLARACGAQVIAGGCFFGHVAPQVLKTGVVDVVVHGEGEVTLVELVRALRAGARRDLRPVKGISFCADHEAVFAGHRPLIPDLDRLPLPAYDLLPVERYGRGSRNHPDFAAIELSRGCLNSCSFCILWRQMGHFQGSRLMPRLRTKSPERLMEEVRILTRRFQRRYLGWVDPCFNADPEVPARVAAGMLQENLRLGQSAWVRADGLLRDEASGALGTCVDAGLNEVYVGIERPDTAGLQALQKHEDLEQCRRALRLLAMKYPHVFTVGSFIYGLAGDTPDVVKAIYRLSLELDLDKAFFIPLAPLPGTPFWRPELWDATGRRFRSCSFLPRSTAASPAPELDRTLMSCFARDWRPSRLIGYWRGLTRCDTRKRRLTWRVFLRSARFAARLMRESFLRQGDRDGMLVPKWYES